MINSQQKRQALKTLLGMVQTVANGGLFALMWYAFYKKKMYIFPFFAKGDIIVILLYTAIYLIFARLYGGFDITFHSTGELTYSHTVAAVLSCGIMYLVTALLMRAVPSVLPMLGMVTASILLGWLWAFASRRLTGKLLAARPMLLIYDNAEAREDGEAIIRSLPSVFRLVDSVSTKEGAEKLYRMMEEKKIRAVMLCGIPSSLRNDLVKYCIDHNVESYVRPNIGDFLIKGAQSLQLDNLPVLLCHRSSPSIWYLAVKRLADILLSLAALVLFSPIMLITAILIKAYDHGPVLYKQVRLTKDRKEFYVYKFRSMKVDAEKDGVARLAQTNDDRITPVGHFIRKTRIDELPQLINILKGEMSFIGPRPERPEIIAQYMEEMPEFAYRMKVKAGLAGYAKLKLDLTYIQNYSLGLDLKLMLLTLKIVFTPEATEGVADGQVTAMQEVQAAGDAARNAGRSGDGL